MHGRKLAHGGLAWVWRFVTARWSAPEAQSQGIRTLGFLVASHRESAWAVLLCRVECLSGAERKQAH